MVERPPTPAPGWRSLGLALVLLGGAALCLVPAPVSVPPTYWEDLIAPLHPGAPLARGFVLALPRRGEAHDVVFRARREAGADGPAAFVDIHIVDRGQWAGIEETRSFGVAWEVVRAGSVGAASEDEARAVTAVLRQAIAANDRGFESVDTIALRAEPASPLVARVLDRLRGWRGWAVGLLVVVACERLSNAPWGTTLLSALLFGVGAWLRASALDLPFVHDQDVQRALTSHLPLSEILLGAGLRDRHPPLYFVLLHFVQSFGQTEAVLRYPAALIGAALAPALLLCGKLLRRRIDPVVVVLALALALSPRFLAAAREVSEIPLYGLLVLLASTSVVLALRDPRPLTLLGLGLSHSLALFTYYLAPFLVVANAAVLACWRRRHGIPARTVAAFLTGVGVGLPIFAVGILTFLRDRGAREVARAFPAWAWGDHSVYEMLFLQTRIAAEAFGPLLLSSMLLAIAYGSARRDLGVITLGLGALATFLGTALLASLARVQAYYVLTVLPALALAAALAPAIEAARPRRLWNVWLLGIGALSILPALSRARPLYVADVDAFMPRFAAEISRRPETRVVTVAHYDKTLLAYYLARARGVALTWFTVDEASDKRIDSLLMVHALGPESEAQALRQLDAWTQAEAVLVIARDGVLPPSIGERLRACELRLEAPTARLLRCAATGAHE